MWCVTTPTISVIINGVPSEPFKTHRGPRQGDPISYFLFNIVSEFLSWVISEAVRKGLISGVKIGVENVVLTHLQYADDTLIFLPNDDNTVSNYKRLLECFSLMTGLEINYSKSTIVSWLAHNLWAVNIAKELKCRIEYTPILYLGISIGGSSKRAKFWDPVIKKIETKLSMWKCKLMSIAGRAQLIRFVLNSLPIYYLSMFRIPNIVARKIVSLQRNFLWGSNSEKQKVITTSWRNMEAPKSLGGLGFGNIHIKNLGLLYKWWFKFANSHGVLWKRVVQSSSGYLRSFP